MKAIPDPSPGGVFYGGGTVIRRPGLGSLMASREFVVGDSRSVERADA